MSNIKTIIVNSEDFSSDEFQEKLRNKIGDTIEEMGFPKNAQKIKYGRDSKRLALTAIKTWFKMEMNKTVKVFPDNGIEIKKTRQNELNMIKHDLEAIVSLIRDTKKDNKEIYAELMKDYEEKVSHLGYLMGELDCLVGNVTSFVDTYTKIFHLKPIAKKLETKIHEQKVNVNTAEKKLNEFVLKNLS